MEVKSENAPVEINVKKLIANKNPGLLKIMPRFVLKFFRNLIHEEEVNGTLRRHKDKYGIDFVNAVLGDFRIGYTLTGEENVPDKGRFLFASNHPLGAMDGLVLISAIHKIRGEVRFLVNDLLLYLKNFDPIFVPINKFGGHSRDAAARIEKAYGSDHHILYFPAGLVSRKRRGRISDLEWKKSFITKAITHKRDVIPVHITGRNSNFFYNLCNLRTFLRIKSNIDMLFLPNEMYKQSDKTLKLTFGKPIPYTFLDKSKTHTEWAKYVRDIVYGLSE